MIVRGRRDSLRELWRRVFRRVGHLGGVSVRSQFGIIVVGVIDANVSPYYLINYSSSRKCIISVVCVKIGNGMQLNTTISLKVYLMAVLDNYSDSSANEDN